MSDKKLKKSKYEERILNELNLILRRDLNDSRLGLTSITKVELNSDKTQARAYWDTFNAAKRGDIKQSLKNAQKKIRFLLAQVLKVRSVPEIEFLYDGQFEEELKITQILDAESKVGKSF